MLLTGNSDRADAFQSARFHERLLQGLPPGLWVDLSAAGMGGATLTNNATRVRVDDDNFARLRRGVDSRYKPHYAPRAPMRCSIASCWRRTNPNPFPPDRKSVVKGERRS